jgi:two-component system cell cycle response regulator CtrA
MRLLLVQSHPAEAKAASLALAATGGVVDHVATAADALDYLSTYEYDLIVLDQTLSDMDGCDAIRRFRAQGLGTPVLMLAAYASGKSRALALRTGADDLLSKPFDKEELVARVEAVVRRRNGFSRSVLRVGPMEIDLASHGVCIDGAPIGVTRKEYSILEMLALRKGRVITKQNFLDHLYNGIDGPETRVIDVFVCNLRKKLAALGAGSLIDTVRGHGYIMRDVPELPARLIAMAPPVDFKAGRFNSGRFNSGRFEQEAAMR